MPAEPLPAESVSVRLGRLASGRIPRFVPTRRSLLIGAGVVVVALGAYAIARESSLFAIERVDVTGGSHAVDAQVSKALSSFVGKSLVGLNGGAVVQRAEALPTVVSATYDRAFPSTLRLRVVPERPVAVLRSGSGAWIVSARGRVMRPVATRSAKTLPRIWMAEKHVQVGELLPSRRGGNLAAYITEADALRGRILAASLVGGTLVFHLHYGRLLVLGRPDDIALKVAVAAKVLHQLPAGTQTIDVSVPSRPVASPQSTSSQG